MSLTPEQIELRRTGIASTDCSAIVGLNPWRSPHDVWEEKLGIAPPFVESAYTEWGRYVEPAIIALWRKRTGRTGREARYLGRHQRTLQHPDKKLFLATPDGLVDDDATLEVKSTGWRVAHHWGEPGTDQIPDYYLTQVTVAMACAQRAKCYVVTECEREVSEYVVQYNDELFNAIAEQCERFWTDHVLTKVPPPADHSKRCAEFLQRYYPRPLGKDLLPSTPEVEDLALELHDCTVTHEAVAKRAASAQNRIKELIGESYGIQTSLGKILWYAVSGRKVADTKGLIALARELGATDDQIDALHKQSHGFRVFRAYWNKELAQ